MTPKTTPSHVRDRPGPKRLQRRRTKGWRKPDGAVYVGRPTKWGNPHQCRTDVRPRFAVALYYDDLKAGRLPFTRDDAREELRGKDLMCWCQIDQPCHADVLLAMANSEGLDA